MKQGKLHVSLHEHHRFTGSNQKKETVSCKFILALRMHNFKTGCALSNSIGCTANFRLCTVRRKRQEGSRKGTQEGQLCFHLGCYQQKPTAARIGKDDFHKDWLLSESKQLSGGITSPTQTPQLRVPFP